MPRRYDGGERFSRQPRAFAPANLAPQTELEFGGRTGLLGRLFPLSAVLPMVTVPTMLHRRVAVLPVVTIVATIGVRIARSEVLAICVRVELRAITRIFDNLLRQCGSSR